MPEPAPTMRAGQRVLARKYRPRTLSELQGQTALVRWFRNAFELGHVPLATILTGERGIGKTSTARIIAKGLNCQEFKQPTGEPCGKCQACTEIENGKHLDVLELDAATDTGVARVRELLESAQYSPVSGRYKVYIIDEAHMLSSHAFAAMTKALEQPLSPSVTDFAGSAGSTIGHSVFMLATTNIRKVPEGIRSRCTRFDLRRLDIDVLTKFLEDLVAREEYTAEAGALTYIANAAEGLVRDSLTLLQQAMSYGDSNISVDTVIRMLGNHNHMLVVDLFAKIVAGKPAEALEQMDKQFSDGAEPHELFIELQEYCHKVYVLGTVRAATASQPDAATEYENWFARIESKRPITPYEAEQGKRLADNLPLQTIEHLWHLLGRIHTELRNSPEPRGTADMAVIRLTYTMARATLHAPYAWSPN